MEGRFGPATSSAIANFQGSNGLLPTGLLDDATGRVLFGSSASQPIGSTTDTTTGTALQLSASIHEHSTPGRQTIRSPVIGEFILTEGFMARGGPHSSKGPALAVFSDNPATAERIGAGVYNLGIDYVTTDGRIDS